MAGTIGILLFDGVEEMGFVGPWEVFAAACDRVRDTRVLTVAQRAAPQAARRACA